MRSAERCRGCTWPSASAPRTRWLRTQTRGECAGAPDTDCGWRLSGPRRPGLAPGREAASSVQTSPSDRIGPRNWFALVSLRVRVRTAMDRLPRRLRRPLSARSRQAATGRPVPAAAVATGAAILAGLSLIAAVAAGGPAASGSQAGRGGVVTGFAAGVSLGGRQLPAGDGAGPPVAGGQARPGGTVTAGLRQFRGIILPDLLVVVPAGLTSAQISGLTAIPGVSSMITFAGGRISAAGHPVSAIGVSPGQFRSWVPLRTASDRALWSGLAAGGFVAADGTAANLQLRPGASYQLTGRSAQDVRFAGLARLGIAGIDVLVGQQVSARLGLVHRVAALISAPGLGMSRLLASVRLITGPTARLVGLRSTRLPVATARPGQIS